MDHRTKTIRKVTLWGAVGNLLLSAFKLVTGIIGNSAAMVADAVHSLSDLVSDVIVLIFTVVAGKGRDKSHDYGHGKFETLATFAVSLILLAVGAKMVASCVSKVHAVLTGGLDVEAPGIIAALAALVSILVKEGLYQWTARVGKKIDSQVMIANAWHHRSDALSSVGSLLGVGGAILLGGKWVILDPLVCGIISIVIIVVAVKMAAPALAELTDASLSEDVEKHIASVIESVDGVQDVHNLKTRRCGHYSVVEAHIVVDPSMSVREAHDITDAAEDRLRAEFGDEIQVTLHIEPSCDAR
ncbi:MAG: cation transporter [Bacteroidales bacterium]|nr:cation transporter [Candidatus Cryptobacteroides aphodequi]